MALTVILYSLDPNKVFHNYLWEMFPMVYTEMVMFFLIFFFISNHNNLKDAYFVLIWNRNILPGILKLFFLQFYSEHLCRLFLLPDEHTTYFK